MTTQRKESGYYFTAGSDGQKIWPDARIHWAQSKAEMLERLQERYRVKVVGVQEGNFGDCYAQFTSAPDRSMLETLANEIPFADESDFMVRDPGTHPGGRMWWVDFVHPVYVAVEEVEECQE